MKIISLKGSSFSIAIDDEYMYHIYVIDKVKDGKTCYQEITNKLSEQDKEELMEDLIYSVCDLVVNYKREM